MLTSLEDKIRYISKVGLDYCFVIDVNMPPRKMMGIESNGMILSAVEEKEDGSEYLRVLTVDGNVAPGSEVG